MGRPVAVVIGSAAGGGFPQWNCRCACCSLLLDGDPRVTARTQAGLAVSATGTEWVLLNASPDLRTQLIATPPLRPRHGARRSSPVTAVVLTGAEIDQTAGLLSLREGQPLTIVATAAVVALLRQNPIFDVLAPPLVQWRSLAEGERLHLAGLEVELFTVQGLPPLFLRKRGEPPRGLPSATGAAIRAADTTLVFVPVCAAYDDRLGARIAGADVLLFDGTFYGEGDMQEQAGVAKTAASMGHIPMDGPEGSLRALGATCPRRIYIHLNNTNPALISGSPEHRRVIASGWEIAEDGMEIRL
jgi:pyrroloquinoline quinone biosynthesis protein B